MTVILIEFSIVLAGLAITAILFYRIPRLPDATNDLSSTPFVSVIIPARNEESNLPLLLQDLGDQTLHVTEIIVVDDASEDATSQVAIEFGAKVIRLETKPEGWTGKSWACKNGADVAKGELLLFLDADVRLGKDGVKTLVQAYLAEDSAISVQPYHKTQELYEQFSIFFNFIQIAANGTALPKPLNIGLYGPVILISGQDYMKSGGHESVRKSVIEDMALGAQLRKTGVPYRLFIGNQSVSFRMYASGFHALLQGWTKNIASGAARTPLALFAMVFLWITSLLSVPIQMTKTIASANWPWLITYSILYLVWVIVVVLLAKNIGKYKLWTLIFYPVLMIVMSGVFVLSAFKKIFGLKVKWKGREIETGEK